MNRAIPLTVGVVGLVITAGLGVALWSSATPPPEPELSPLAGSAPKQRGVEHEVEHEGSRSPVTTARGTSPLDSPAAEPSEPDPVDPYDPHQIQASKDDINAGTEALLRGDSAFAASMYEEIIEDPGTAPPLALFAKYKLAWAYIDLDRTAEAHALMQTVMAADGGDSVQLQAVINQAKADYAEWEPLP